MDFFKIETKFNKNGSIDVYPEFVVGRTKDIMVRGRSFYAIWDEANHIWSTDEYDVARLVDEELRKYVEDNFGNLANTKVNVRYMKNYSSNSWKDFKRFLKDVSDNAKQLDTKLAFADTDIKRSDYISRRLTYSLEDKECPAWDEIVGTLYSPEERAKIEWAIGSVVAGDSVNIQKFFVFYGDPGSGKSTILHIIEKLFDGYYTVFEAKDLVGKNNSFSMEQFNINPLVAIQHDGDLSKIEDNTKLNSIISHESMLINEKFKSPYYAKLNCMLFMATNKPVKITDGKAGIIRRLVDITPTGDLLSPKRYDLLYSKIDFELGAIANRCLNVYHEMGKNYFNKYKAINMMYKTDTFFNFVEDSYEIFEEQDGTTLKAAYSLYKVYKEEAGLDFVLPMYRFREELKNYFKEFYDMARIDNKQVRSYYKGFLKNKFTNRYEETEEDGDNIDDEHPYSLTLEKQDSSIFDEYCKDCKAQYANSIEAPSKKWDNVRTKLSNIDTTKLHYVIPPKNMVVIDFDLKDQNGEKSYELNLEAASKWPATYAEVSKGGNGIHLHYIYDGDVSQLARLYDKDIEIKTFPGNAALRRKLTACNALAIATISSGLPLKEKKMVNFDAIKNEKALRTLIEKNLRKEIHPGTKPSIDFIAKILEDAYSSGMKYDVTDLRPKIMAFANNSSHQADYCIKVVNRMIFQSDESSEAEERYLSDDIIFYDVEVFSNLFVVVYKILDNKLKDIVNEKNQDKLNSYCLESKNKCVKMINPTPTEIEGLLKHKLIGFNCRRYDNHIMYARMMGYTNEQLYILSQRIINQSKNCFFGEAYNLSYTDVYDFASAGNKMSLKKWEIELGIHHQECPLPWDQPVDEKDFNMVADYCCNDVVSTEATFHKLEGDWVARQILSELSGLSVNDTTNNHTTRIIFGYDKHPQDQFIYTDLSKMFPGYKFENGKSYYKGFEVGEGGFVYAEPGMYGDVALIDVASMHPSSIENLNLFGDKYTKRFSDIKKARIAIKHKDIDSLKDLLDGALVKYVNNADFNLKDLSNALKTVINSVYGLTSAKFDNKFRDPRNIDNIVAKRGALFMIDLLEAVKKKGFCVAHIKTDSIKIPDATPEIIQFVINFGKKYGYDFEHEATYDKMCLVNDAVYIARYKDTMEWTATGAEFAVPYIYKSLFTKEPITFNDLCITKAVTSSLYLDMNEELPDVTEAEKELKKVLKEDPVDEDAAMDLKEAISKGHNYIFVGRVGQFCPILPGCGGGELYSLRDNGNYYSVAGAKGYRFLESETVVKLGKEKDIDESYFLNMASDAIDHISEFGDFDWFVSDSPYDGTMPFN